MNNIPSSTHPNVPAIHIQDADDSPQFPSGEFNTETFNINIYNPFFADADGQLFYRTQDFSSSIPDSSLAELEDIGLPHLTASLPAKQPFLTGHHYTASYVDPHFLQESLPGYVDGGLSPSSLGSSIPSPTSSFTSLSPSSYYEGGLSLSDVESPISPPLTTPELPYFFSSRGASNESLVISESQPVPSGTISPHVFTERQSGPQRHRSSSVSRSRVASQAMLEANGRRRRHPAQFRCEECNQTFTALFSLKRHQQSHTGERPFACGIPGCGQRFFNSSDCKRHEKSRKRHKDLMMQ